MARAIERRHPLRSRRARGRAHVATDALSIAARYGLGAALVLLRTAQTPPPLDGPGIAAVLTRPREATLARAIIEAALRGSRGLDEARRERAHSVQKRHSI